MFVAIFSFCMLLFLVLLVSLLVLLVLLELFRVTVTMSGLSRDEWGYPYRLAGTLVARQANTLFSCEFHVLKDAASRRAVPCGPVFSKAHCFFFGTDCMKESLLIGVQWESRRPCQLQACVCLLYTSPSPRDATLSRMPSSA